MCRSELSDDQIATLVADIKARQPKTCPVCGGSDIVPTFLERADWECLNANCLAWWTPQPGSN